MKLVKDFLTGNVKVKVGCQDDVDKLIEFVKSLKVDARWPYGDVVSSAMFLESFPVFSMSRRRFREDARNRYFFSSDREFGKWMDCKEFFWKIEHDNLYGFDWWEVVV